MSSRRRVPDNECANLAIRGTRYPIEDLRRALLADDRLPIRFVKYLSL